MNDMAEFSGLPSGVAEALDAGTLGDPFAVLGPHDTGMGREIRAFLPGALEVEALATKTGEPIGRLAPTTPQGLFVGRAAAPSRTGCASSGRTLCRKPKIHILSGPSSATSICTSSTKGGILKWRRIWAQASR